MKKTFAVFALAMALLLSACSGQGTGGSTGAGFSTPSSGPASSAPAAPSDAESPEPAEPPLSEHPEAYAALIRQYAAALAMGGNGGELSGQDLNPMLASLYGDAPFRNTGYAVVDLDGDGVSELVVGATADVTDEFYGKLVLDLYTLAPDGTAALVFRSQERNRIYYAGENKFASLGSSGAADSFVTTVKLEGGELIDMTYTTEPDQYVQLPLSSFAKSRAETNDPLDLYSWDEETDSYIPYQSAGGDSAPIGEGNGWYYFDADNGGFQPW